jgi:hypothetical protein
VFTLPKIPTYKELLELPDAELKRCVDKALEQLRLAEERGQTTTEKTKAYMLYKNELTKRTYRRRHH